MAYIRWFIGFFNIFCMSYTLLLSFLYLMQLLIAYLKLRKNNKLQTAADYLKYEDSENLLPVSLLVPAYNEQENIVQNVRSLMEINYNEFEIIVVNDGSIDSTHDFLITSFGLKKIEYTYKVSIPTKTVRGIYYNSKYPNLIYVDKENGGKSDALNAGINVSAYPLFACLDADSRIEKDAILKISTEFIKDTQTVVAGGIVRIANGSVVEDGEWKSFTLPDGSAERFQIVEYFRSFLAGRLSWAVSNSMLIVSGAFGVFKKQVVIECGGYKTNTVGEDMEIVVRIHKYLRRKKRKYSIKFCADAVCWTQGPMSLDDVRKQRRRWHIGLMDTLFSHKTMFLNIRYGFLGMVSMPYSWLFEFLGAPVEVIGYFIIPLSLLMGELSPFFFLLYLSISIILGIILSLGGLILEQTTKQGYMSAKQCMQLAIYAILENFGYRQFVTLCRVEGIFKYKKLKNTWGNIKRREFNIK